MQNSADDIVDQILVLDAQQGRLKAFEMLVSRWQKRLWWHAYNLSGEAEAAWDITQESWLGIVRGIGRLEDPAKFGAWAFRIVTHKASDWRRKNRQNLPTEIQPEEPLAAEQQQRDTAKDVHSIIRRLPDGSKAVLSLYYFEGFALGEIARILGTAEGTVKSRLHAARAEFRRLWEALGEPSAAAKLPPRKDK